MQTLYRKRVINDDYMVINRDLMASTWIVVFLIIISFSGH